MPNTRFIIMIIRKVIPLSHGHMLLQIEKDVHYPMTNAIYVLRIYLKHSAINYCMVFINSYSLEAQFTDLATLVKYILQNVPALIRVMYTTKRIVSLCAQVFKYVYYNPPNG